MLNSKSTFFNSDKFFYLLLALTLLAIFFTNPFLRYPYDMYTHLKQIDEQSLATAMPSGRGLWHYTWAQIFHLFHIDRTEIFLRAYIIHYMQSISSFLMLFYFSKIFIKNLFTDISPLNLNYLGYWSTIIWFTVFANASGYYQQVWILWYSINYQITLPLTLLVTGLSISLLFEDDSKKVKMIKAALIIVLSYAILRFHAMEFIYYLMYMTVLIVVYLDKILALWKKYIFFAFPATLFFIYAFLQFIDYIKTYAYRQSPIFNYLSLEKLPQLLEKISSEGNIVTWYYNKAYYILNELTYLSLVSIIVLFLLAIFRYYKKYSDNINMRFVVFLLVTSLFIVIPVFQYTAGIASLLTYDRISYRFYYSALLFLAIPSSVFYLVSIFKIKNVLILNVILFTILLGTFYYSKYNIEYHQNYYRNIISIKDALNSKKIGFNLSKENIATIGQKLKYYESLNTTEKPKYYYARDDIAFVVKFIYQKPVFYARRGTLDYTKSYREHNDKKYYPVLLEVPENFPVYHRGR